MRTRSLTFIISLFLFAIALYGCDSGAPTPVPAPIQTSVPTSVLTPTLSLTLTPKLTGTSSPILTPIPQATIASLGIMNISQTDYDAALAKWRAADVRDYRMEVSNALPYGGEMSGQWRLRVRDGKIVEIYQGDTRIYVDGDNRSLTPNPEINPDNLHFLTVEGQFDTIKKALDDPASRVLTISGKSYKLDYNIKFNDRLGYPELLGTYPLITDNDRIISVPSLEVLEQGPDATITVAASAPTQVSGTGTPSTGAANETKPEPLPEVVIEKGSEASQKAYDEALAKWQAAGVEEYEFTSNVYSEGVEQKWTIHVNDGEPTVISSTEGPDVTPGDLKGLLVKDQFNSMARVLAGDDSAGVEQEGTQYYVTYVVNFDAKLYYPARFELRVKPGPIMDLGFVIEVESFKVIRRANP